MLSELVRPRERPVTNVVAVFVIVVTFAPLVIAHMLAQRAGDGGITGYVGRGEGR
jgi:putative spermidine/putrescine transport system permease protein